MESSLPITKDIAHFAKDKRVLREFNYLEHRGTGTVGIFVKYILIEGQRE